MTWTIPKATPYSLKPGESGLAVWALQRALNSALGSGLVEDGAFGPRTFKAVVTFQDLARITADGKPGPVTQQRLGAHLAVLVDPDRNLPGGLLNGIITGESGGYVAAVNWSVPGGVDVGYTQRRLYEPYTQTAITRGFDSKYQISLLARSLRDLYETYRGRAGVTSREMAMRLAVLRHNYPYASDTISRKGILPVEDAPEGLGLSAYWFRRADWVERIGAHFPDGYAVLTPLNWARRYSLGSPEHNEPGFMVRSVDWSTL